MPTPEPPGDVAVPPVAVDANPIVPPSALPEEGVADARAWATSFFHSQAC